jgi:putative glutamine amidotransferase
MHGPQPYHLVAEKYVTAILDAAGGVPLIVPAIGRELALEELLDSLDGLLFMGSPSNVEPRHYRGEPSESGTLHDPYRDETTLPLIPRAVAAGVPVLGICRGFQEINVAYGGSLHPEIRDLPGRMNHRAPRLPNGEFHPDIAVVFADRHEVRLTPGGVFAKLLGTETIRVNSLHGQGILKPGERVVIEGVAEDETIEAIRIDDAPGFALGVQWHAEHDANSNPINRTLFEAFGAALVKYQKAR